MTRRLLLSYLTVTLVVLVMLEVPLAVFYQQRELDRLTVDAERDATVLATIYEDALEKDLVPDPAPAADYRTTTGVRVVVVDDAGISIVDTDADLDRDFSTRPEIETALTGRRSTGTRRSDTLDTELLYVAVPVASGGRIHGALRLTLDTHEVTVRIWRFWFGLVAVGFTILTVMAGVGWLIARSVTRPVRALRATAARFSGGDLTPAPLDEGAPAELIALHRAMNDMARRLDELIATQRAFVADASHQLRTPLTALRLRLENLESAAIDPGGELAAAIDETARLGSLVDDLLQLARAEQPHELVSLDLAEIVRDRVDTWDATAEQSQVGIALTAPDTAVFAQALAGGVEQVLDNLLDNAIRASPAASTITVALRAGDDVHTIEVADAGQGIADADKAAALSRFWRADTTTPGTGLGLAIAQAIVEAGGGTLSLSDNVPQGLRASITLRAAPGATPHEHRRNRRLTGTTTGRAPDGTSEEASGLPDQHLGTVGTGGDRR